MAPQKVQYLRYARFLRISRTDQYAAFFEIAQALILNFLQRHLKIDFLRARQCSGEKNAEKNGFSGRSGDFGDCFCSRAGIV
ncbi:hypothetical protein HNR65_001425 [Desulfosalsimonas propionicica]|uniref:Uncharacterized protein n=1 Tax=Desulfosalsimonas propionicica TaxID=332175 RepID=A0A7W0C8F2_9BACT|nr:hypothetical protein [Desulfosalsimonas propionicica]MBA2881099.1 hypothetical protein [Desulfosalsimonas propionicica]